MSDRRVHAVLSDGTEVVRYDRAGKWYLEKVGSRQAVKFADATRAVLRDAESEVRFGVPGGGRFDKAVGG